MFVVSDIEKPRLYIDVSCSCLQTHERLLLKFESVIFWGTYSGHSFSS